MKSKILLTTLNAKYAHTAIGLRYLYANLKELKSSAAIKEYIIADNINEVAEKIISSAPAIVGFSVYIWNALEASRLINIIKKVAPEIIIVLGGPEISYLPFRVNFGVADYVIQGEGENSFYSLCKSVLDGELPNKRIIKSELVDLKEIQVPYDFYTDEDIAHRVIYVEASRGCPFSCEFCLSSIDKTVREFDIDIFLSQMAKLWDRGVRKFKFVDRTFNLNINNAERILDFFLQKKPPYFIHCEVIPECFPESLKEKIKQFPPTTIQLEIGVQTLNPKTAETIKRKLDFEKVKQNLLFLGNDTNAHLHVDLIVGLPGESIEDFGDNLNTLTALSNSEIQLGILKKLSGTSISRHDEEYGMVYSDLPPYEILKNDLISFKSMQQIKRFVRFWDLVYNSGNFNKTASLLWKDGEVFKCFYDFSEWVFSQTEATWKISLNRLAELILKYLVEVKNYNKTEISDIIVKDLLVVPGRRIPGFLRDQISFVPEVSKKEVAKMYHRQIKHLEKTITIKNKGG